MATAAREAGVLIVTGDTKVVPRGAADKIFITTTGIGEILVQPSPSGSRAQAGDAVLVSGSMGDHGLTILSQRAGLSLAAGVQSDSAALHAMTEALTLEVGIVSHPDDTLRLANPVVVSGLADAIASGIDACLNPVPEEDEDVPDQAQDASA